VESRAIMLMTVQKMKPPEKQKENSLNKKQKRLRKGGN
jgi:hypothetical protein